MFRTKLQYIILSCPVMPSPVHKSKVGCISVGPASLPLVALREGEDRMAENLGQRPRVGWCSWEGIVSHRLASLEERCELPQRGSGQSPDRPKVFLASPVAYHAAIGGRDPRASPLRTPLALRGHSISVHDVTLFIQFFFSLPRALDSGVIPSRISCFRYVDFLTMCRKCCSFPMF